jgi:hypothetical protein
MIAFVDFEVAAAVDDCSTFALAVLILAGLDYLNLPNFD